MIKIVNLTPHVVNVNDVAIQPEKVSARVETVTTEDGNIVTQYGEINIVETHYGLVENLPDWREGIVYVVSRLVKDRVPNRNDVFVPGELNRDENGRITGCKNLSL